MTPISVFLRFELIFFFFQTCFADISIICHHNAPKSAIDPVDVPIKVEMIQKDICTELLVILARMKRLSFCYSCLVFGGNTA